MTNAARLNAARPMVARLIVARAIVPRPIVARKTAAECATIAAKKSCAALAFGEETRT